MDVKHLQERIYSNSRLEMIFFMFSPECEYTKRDRTAVQVKLNPVLYLRYKKKDGLAEEFDFVKSSYKINPKNLYYIIKFFNVCMKWLYSDEFQDLFLRNSEGNLIVNADYKSLKAITHKGDYESQIMTAIPSVVELGDKVYEGIRLFINETKYCVPLTYEEVGIIFSIISTFSFPNEVCAVLQAYDFVNTHSDIIEFGSKGFNGKTPFD